MLPSRTDRPSPTGGPSAGQCRSSLPSPRTRWRAPQPQPLPRRPAAPAQTSPGRRSEPTESSPGRSAGQNVGQVVVHLFLELVEAAGAGVAVGPPADELRCMPEPGSLHVVVSHLDDSLGSQRHEREVLAGVPAAVLGLTRVPDSGGL